MMHKASRSIQEVPYCSSRSFIQFKWHTGKKVTHLITISLSFWITPVSNQRESCKRGSFEGHRRRFSLFFMVIIAFSMSHRPHKVTRPVVAIKSLRFALLYSTYANDLGLSLFIAQTRSLSHIVFTKHTNFVATRRGSQQHFDVVYNTFDNELSLGLFTGTTPLCIT